MRKNLWAPWRMDFILKAHRATKGCVFCDLPKRGSKASTLILYQGKGAFIILNRYPYTNGHLMVVPRRHLSDLSRLTQAEHAEIGGLLGKTTKILKKMVKAQGFNVGLNLGRVAGAGIEGHLHYHVVPRWSGDTNFMPVIGAIKTIPEHLRVTYQRLAGEFNKI